MKVTPQGPWKFFLVVFITTFQHGRAMNDLTRVMLTEKESSWCKVEGDVSRLLAHYVLFKNGAVSFLCKKSEIRCEAELSP